MKTLKSFLALACLILIIFSACSRGKKENGQKVVTFNLRSEGKTIDPQLTTSESSSKVASMCMEGLVNFGKNEGEIIPGVAEKWDRSENNKKIRFYLRNNAYWSNGEQVTAADFYFAIKRALEPMTASQYAYLLYNINNAKEFNTGEINDFSKVGVKQVDRLTIDIELKNAAPYFEQILAMPICYPLNEKFYDSVRDQYALESSKMLYNGAYTIRKWIPNGKYEFKKNSHYWNKDSIKINRIDFLMVDNYNTAANMFKTHELDMCMITGNQLPQFKDKKYFHKKKAGGIWYIQFNLHNKYFKNRKIRRAFSLAINRTVLCEKIRKDGSIPARSFVSPTISGGTIEGEKTTFRKRFGESYFNDDPVKARQLYEEGMKELGLEKPAKVKLLLGTQNVSIRDGQFIQQELYKYLGVIVELEPSTFQGRLHKMDQQNYDFVYAGWSPDFDDPINLLDLWITDGGNNRTGFSNENYDKDIHIAQTSPDDKARMKALGRAEKILMYEMPVIPLYFPVRLWLIRDWLKNVVFRPTGIELSFNWAYIKD